MVLGRRNCSDSGSRYSVDFAETTVPERNKHIMVRIPECPWPEDIWPMTVSEYVQAVPDPHKRTAISGFLMREGWNICIRNIKKELNQYHGNEVDCIGFGRYVISKLPNGKLWISCDMGEGGEFDAKVFESAVEKFYAENF